MKILSLNISSGRRVNWRGREIETGIFKEPVSGPLRVRLRNLDGDRQADLRVHGGLDKAIYAYAAEDYAWWRRELGREDLGPGAFGENLTTEGLDLAEVAVGERFRAGEAILEAVQPRLPCFKLGLRFGDPGVVRTFAQRGRWGIYFRVIREGQLAAGDPLERVERPPEPYPVYGLARLRLAARPPVEEVRRALRAERLAADWREELEEILQESHERT